MRGTVAPIGMGAVFALLEALPPTDRDEVLKKWRELKPPRGGLGKSGISGRAKAVLSSGAQRTKKPKKAVKGNQRRNHV